ncbi:hypothetical protein [Nocardioides bruguierae]|uniref:Big-1 domain-containing protein n=1 Tax=Nocardioides bruguierae TaxID=2945102 RepID=A0A9X2IER0_9ACTN|nr:hypothetical protein [Nocardioides bruguierae]MCM0620557.1 hypothetical protein [Nocardioides bruguierae]
MNSSGIKRGLATTAVAALAIAGLPLLAGSASAESVATSAGVTADDVMMVDPGSVVSTKDDGQNTSVRLTAIGGANVTGVTFEYSIGGASWTTIGTATGDNGTFAYEWSPGALSGALLTVRATATLAGGGTTDDAVPGVTVLNSAETTNITDGGALGVFRAPYGGDHVIVHGTGSTSSAPDLAYFADGMFQDGGTADDTTAAGASTGSWTGVVDISGTATMASPYVYGAPNQLLLRASGATEDTEAFGLYEQTITTVTAEAADDVLPTGESTDVTVTVTDQNGMPIAGARVSDSSDVDSFLTDADGQATFSQAAGSNAYYYADATAAAGYQSVLGDKKSDTVTVDQYLPAETELDATSADGAAFDMDEYAPGDVTVQVKDQNGNPVDEAGRTVTYHWEYTLFDSAVDPGETTEATATTDGTGTATIAFPTGGPSGSYTLVAELEGDGFGNGAIAASEVLTVKAGEAAFTSDPDTVQAMAGGDVDVDAVLALEDGTPLPKRDLSADYVGDDAMVLDADGDPQASVALTTDADGVATATVSDPVTDPQTEESGTLTFRDPQFDNEAVSVEFLLDLTPGVVDVDVDMPGAFGGDSAGELQRITVTVSSADENGDADDPLANTEVELSLDHGYFTDGKAGAAGTMAGEWADEGDTMTVTTDGSGEAPRGSPSVATRTSTTTAWSWARSPPPPATSPRRATSTGPARTRSTPAR